MQTEDVYLEATKIVARNTLLRSQLGLPPLANPDTVYLKVIQDLLQALEAAESQYFSYLQLRQKMNLGLSEEPDRIHADITHKFLAKVQVDDPELLQVNALHDERIKAERAVRFANAYDCYDCGHAWDENDISNCPECGSNRVIGRPIVGSPF